VVKLGQSGQLRVECSTQGSPLVTPCGRGTVRAEDAQRTPTQSHILPSVLVYEDKWPGARRDKWNASCGPLSQRGSGKGSSPHPGFTI
jgi:hypothetical protein